MKYLTFAALITSLLVLSVAGMAQEKKMERIKQARMMEMMKDSSMVKMIMEHIAEDNQMRTKMMQKMMQSTRGDEGKMMEMCKTMLEDENMHSMMMKMMGGEMQTTEMAGPEILVKFKPEVQAAQIKAMTEEIGLQKIKDIKELNIKVFKITSKKSLEEVIALCEKIPFVEYAEPNQTYRTQKK